MSDYGLGGGQISYRSRGWGWGNRTGSGKKGVKLRRLQRLRHKQNSTAKSTKDLGKRNPTASVVPLTLHCPKHHGGYRFPSSLSLCRRGSHRLTLGLAPFWLIQL